MKKILLALFVSMIGLAWFGYANEPMIYFWGDGCPACAIQNEHFEELEQEYDFDLKRFEIYYNEENQELMQEYSEVLGEELRGVPTIIMWDDHFVGADYDDTEELIQKYAVEGQEGSIDHREIIGDQHFDDEGEKDWEQDEDMMSQIDDIETRYIAIGVIVLMVLVGSGFVIFKQD